MKAKRTRKQRSEVLWKQNAVPVTGQEADLSRVHSLSYRSRMFWGRPA